MSFSQSFSIKNLVTGKNITIEDNTAIYPLFNCTQSKIKTYFESSTYTKKYRKAVRWDFGDGTITEGSTAEHYYKIPGKYKISCTFYDLDRKPIENKFNVTVIVKEIIPLKLNFSDNNVQSDLACSKISKLVSLESSFGADISTSPPIVINRISDNKAEKSYHDIKNNKFYHLERYYTFLKENITYSYKKDNSDKNITLTPSKFFTPKYSPIYAKFISNGDNVDIKLYVYKENDKIKLPQTYTIYNPLARVNINHLNDKDYLKTVNLEVKTFLSDLPAGAEHCGWIGVENIWYKDDYIGEKELYFSHDISYIKFYNNRNNLAYSNIPPLGIKINVYKPMEDITYGLSYNGLLSDYTETQEDIDNHVLPVEKHLAHNFYTNYEVEAYLGRYIKNEKFGDNQSWSLLKDDTEIEGLSVTRCDIKQDENNNWNYYRRYLLTPTGSEFTLSANDLKYTHGNLFSLGSVNLPQKKYKYISFDAMLDAYMPHPMFEDKVMLKDFFGQIFKTDYLFENINNKGFDFFDDMVNHKTCYINNLQSILQMFDKPDYTYNITSFDKINELKELCRILSMQFTDLMGQYEISEENIKVLGDYKGNCVGDRLLPTDIIVCNYEYKIVGVCRDGKFMPVLIPTSKLILVDDFTHESRLVSFEGVESKTKCEVTEEMKYYYPEHFYTLNDYSYRWGWNLKLRDEEHSNMGNTLDASYSVYLYLIDKVVYERMYNYLDEATIPYSEKPTETYITVEEWNAEYGYIYNCLMKVLLYKLGLN